MKKCLLLFVAIASFVGVAGSAACHIPVAPYNQANSCIADVDSCPADFRLPECVWDGRIYGSAFVGGNTVKCFHKNLSFKDNVVGLIAVGYQYSSVRGELEVSYRYNEYKKYGHQHEIVSKLVKGHVSSIGVLANAYYDFANSTRFTPYVGVGAGFAHLKAKISPRKEYKDNSNLSNHKNTNRFAWQMIAGVSTPITDNIDLGIEYRYMRIQDFSRNQSVGVSARYTY